MVQNPAVQREMAGRGATVELRPEETRLTHVLYADDLALMCRSPRLMQALLDSLAVYADAKGLTVNVKKTCVMHFHFGAGLEPRPCFHLQGGATGTC